MRLRKALYGTRQAGHAWQNYLSGIFEGEGGKRNLKDECVYTFKEGEGVCIIGTHVDDLFPLYNEEGKKIRDRVFRKLEEKMEIDNKGEIKYALDTCIETDREKGTLRISQEVFISNMIKEFNLQESHGKETPGPVDTISETDLPVTDTDIKDVSQLPIRNAIGKLWWAALISRPDIVCALHKCASWQNKPSKKLWTNILWIMKYLKQTIKYAIVYKREQDINVEFEAFCDASFATESKSKSRIGYVYFVHGCLVAWGSVHTTRVVTSSTEAEAYALVVVCQENTWIRDFMQEISNNVQKVPTIIHQDNKGAISLTNGGGQHKRSKHFQIEFDMLREKVREKEIEIKYMETNEMIADMFTKMLHKPLFQKHRNKFMEEGGEKKGQERKNKTMSMVGVSTSMDKPKADAQSSEYHPDEREERLQSES